ncbi:unnamed protein product, partial [Rotaria sp. Silwood1]
MHNLDKLPSEQSVKAIDDILEDIAFRKKCLLSRLGTATSLLESKPEQVKLFNNTIINSIRKLEIISVIEKELDYLRENLRAIEQYTDEYDKLLRDDQFQDIPCSKYILLLEMLRVRTEELEIFNYFPKITQLIEEWQSDHSVDNEFKPKVLDLFKSVELDNAKQTATPSDTDSNQYVKQEPTYHIQNKNPTVQNASLIAGHTGTIIGHTGIILGALGKVADDAARLIIPSSSIALRAISIAGIVVGAVLTPVFAAWTFYYTGKRMTSN